MTTLLLYYLNDNMTTLMRIWLIMGSVRKCCTSDKETVDSSVVGQVHRGNLETQFQKIDTMILDL